MTVRDLIALVDTVAPWGLAEEWDNVGLLVGRRDQKVSKVLVALDLRDHVLDQAVAEGFDVVLTHHPVIFPTLGAMTDATAAGALVLRAAQQGIAVVAAHTNLDSAAGGLNDLMAQRLGINDLRPLRPLVSDPSLGLGRVGTWGPGSLTALVAHCRAAFGDPPVTFTGKLDQPVRTVAVCTGSGASLIADALAADVDVYVTGDLKYHDADHAGGLSLVCVPHGVVESAVLAEWMPTLAEAVGGSAEVAMAARRTDPWAPAA